MIGNSIYFNTISSKTSLQWKPSNKLFSQEVLPSKSSTFHFQNAPVLRSKGAAVSPHPLHYRNAAVSSWNEDSASPHPSIWGDRFLQISQPVYEQDVQTDERVAELKKETKRMLQMAANEPLQQMDMVNNIQRLGLAYHCQSEIEEALEMMHKDTSSHHVKYDLHSVALQFRLLRQAGHYVPPDVFEKFKNENGDFPSNLSEDVKGMLSLYEAAHVSFKGEDILEEAISFTTHHLKCMVNHLSPILAKQVRYALELPLHKRFPRIEAREYIFIYQKDNSRNELLLEFAKLDFNRVQSMHQKEVAQLSRWWIDIDILNKQPFPTRDRLVELYLVALAFDFEPEHTIARRYVTKLFSLISVLDEYFDVHFKMDELELLTDVVLRWDMEAIDELPHYMKVTVLELFKILNEIEQEMIEREQQYSTIYIKQEMQNYVKNLLVECKLMETGHIPKLEELYRSTIVTIGLSTTMVFLVAVSQEHPSKESLDWIISWPKIMISTNLICRIIDDITTFKFEQKRGLNISGVTCYMKEHGVSESEAIENLRKLVRENWKDLNKECMRSTIVPMQVLVTILNYARAVEVIYLRGDGDGYTNSRGYTKHLVTMLLVNPIPI